MGDLAGHDGGHGLHVVAVHVGIGDAIAACPPFEGDLADDAGVGELGEVVVLAQEDDREVFDRGQVDRFVEGALGHRAIAEEGHGDLGALAQLHGGGRARGDGEAGADDAVGAEDSHGQVGDVHRSAAAAAAAVGAAEQFGEHLAHVGAFGQDVSVASVGGGDDVVGAQGCAGADRDRFLPD